MTLLKQNTASAHWLRTWLTPGARERPEATSRAAAEDRADMTWWVEQPKTANKLG